MTSIRPTASGSRSSGVRAIVRHAARQHLDHAPLAPQHRAQHLLLQRRVEAADDDAPGLHPFRHAVEGFEQDVAGTFAGGDEAEQRHRQQRRLASADYSRGEFRADTLGAVRLAEMTGAGFILRRRPRPCGT
jgi:hypothetical protein